MNRLEEYGYAGLYKALKHKYKYALSTNLPCVSRRSQFLALLCIFPELISLQESCRIRFRLSSCLFEISDDHPLTAIEIINNTRGGIVIFFTDNKRERVYWGANSSPGCRARRLLAELMLP